MGGRWEGGGRVGRGGWEGGLVGGVGGGGVGRGEGRGVGGKGGRGTHHPRFAQRQNELKTWLDVRTHVESDMERWV